MFLVIHANITLKTYPGKNKLETKVNEHNLALYYTRKLFILYSVVNTSLHSTDQYS